MNKYLNKNFSKLILIFLIFQPIIDVMTAFSINYFKLSFTFGMVVRFLFLLFCLCYIFFMNKEKNKKIIYIYFAMLILYSVLFVTNIYFNEGRSFIFFNISNLLKVIYIPVVLIFFYLSYKEKKLNIDCSYFGKIYLIYLFFIFVPNILGIGFNAYEVTKKGSIGFFYTANEVSAIISILMPFYLCYVKNMSNKLFKVILFLIFLYVLFSIGTKSPLLSLGIILICYLFITFGKLYKKKDYKKISCIFCLLVVFLLCFIIIIPQTNFYKNIDMHLKYLKVDSIDDMTKPKIIDRFIFSERLTFLSSTNDIYKNKNIISKLFGIGYTNNGLEMKTIEMDYVDIFYHHGIVGFIITLLPYIILVFYIVRDYVFYKKKKDTKIYLLSFILSIILAFFTGHVLLSSGVFIFVALVMNMFYNEIRVV